MAKIQSKIIKEQASPAPTFIIEGKFLLNLGFKFQDVAEFTVEGEKLQLVNIKGGGR